MLQTQRTPHWCRLLASSPVIGGLVLSFILWGGAAQYSFPGLGVFCFSLGQRLHLRHRSVLIHGRSQGPVTGGPFQNAYLRWGCWWDGAVLYYHGRPQEGLWRITGLSAKKETTGHEKTNKIVCSFISWDTFRIRFHVESSPYVPTDEWVQVCTQKDTFNLKRASSTSLLVVVADPKRVFQPLFHFLKGK